MADTAGILVPGCPTHDGTPLRPRRNSGSALPDRFGKPENIPRAVNSTNPNDVRSFQAPQRVRNTGTR